MSVRPAMQTDRDVHLSSGISRHVRHILRGRPGNELPAVLVLTETREISEILALLGLSEVSGAIVGKTVAGRLGSDQRIGVITDDGNWLIPCVGAHSLLLLSGGRILNIKRGLSAWRSGIRYVFTLDNLNSVTRARLHRRIAQRFFVLLSSKLQRLADRYLRMSSTLHARLTERRLGKLLQKKASMPNGFFDQTRIMLVNNNLAAGGTERQLVNTALALSNEGRGVSIQCYELGSEEFDFYRNNIEPAVPLFRTQSLLDIVATLEPAETEALGRMIDDAGFVQLTTALPHWVVDDIVVQAANLLVRRPGVVHFWQDYTNVVGGLAAALLGVPKVVLGMRSMAPFRFPHFYPFMAPVYRALASCPAVEMINNSEAGALDYASWLGIAHGRVGVILNGIGELQLPPRHKITSWRLSLGIPADAVVVGSVFRFWPEKDPLLWLETAAIVAEHRDDAYFLLVGAGPMQAEMEQRAEKLGIRSRLVLPGTQRDLPLAMAAMDMFLLTSHVEGTPNVLIEAQYLGCPVVTTIAGGSAETVENGKTGWVVAERSARQLADRVLESLGDSAWLQEARATAPENASKKFGIERMVAETKHAYGFSS